MLIWIFRYANERIYMCKRKQIQKNLDYYYYFFLRKLYFFIGKLYFLYIRKKEIQEYLNKKAKINFFKF